MCTFACTYSLLLGVRAPFVSCLLTGAILPVFIHLPPVPSPQSPPTVPCNPEAQCLAATLTTHWTATCCVQSPHPASPSHPHPPTPHPHPAPIPKPPHFNPPTPALFLTTKPSAPRGWGTSVLLLTYQEWDYLLLCKARALTIPIWIFREIFCGFLEIIL